MKWSWGTSITIVYTAFALATLGFVAFAMTQRVDLVRIDYYDEALRHDDMQLARQRAYHAGNHIILKGDTLRLARLCDSVEMHDVDLEWQRAQNPAMDVRTKYSLHLLHAHGISTRHLHRGRWSVRLRWQQLNQAYQIDTIVVL